jgi:hypothetical protein
MSRTTDGIAKIEALTRAVMQDRQNRLSVLSERERALRAQLDALDRDRRDVLGRLNPESPAARAGSTLTWDIWIARRKRELNMELARTLLLLDRARTDLSRSLGRHEATADLAERLQRQARLERLRRLDNHPE